MSNLRRLGALLLTLVAVLGATVLSPISILPPASAHVRVDPVTVTVLSVSPATPAITSTPKPLTITVTLRNTTATAYRGVTVTGERGAPILSQSELNSSLTSADARTDGKAITASKAAMLTLAPGATVSTTFQTTTSNQNDDHVCLCVAAGVYPIDLTARSTVGGTPQVLGGTRTYLPVFDVQPARKVGVTWIWPLIDRPHRAGDGKVFTDDDLATSVSGGRLDRALQVVEKVGPNVPLTLVVDPDLIDELQVMSLGNYTVQDSNGTVTAGTGQQAAATWLDRLRAVLAARPAVDVEFTPPADPDVTGLSQHEQTWATNLSATVTADVTTALGGNRVPTHAIAWPPTNSATVETLDRLVSGGARAVVLDGSRVAPSTKAGVPLSSARLRTSSRPVDALLTTPTLQRYAQSAMAGSSAALPALVAELAVRVAQHPNTAQSAVLTAARYVDPQFPDLAAAVISTTSSSIFTEAVAASTAIDALAVSTASSSVRAPVRTSTGLSTGQLAAISAMTSLQKPVTSLIDGTTAGHQVLASLPAQVQRSESAAWSRAGATTGVGGGPTPGAVRTSALTAQLSGYLSRVSILPPQSGSYTLASGDSPLPISVRNDNNLSVQVRVPVTTVGGLPGLTTHDNRTHLIPANQKLTIKVPTKVEGYGRIPVQAQLRTPDDYPIGDPVELFIHSTVLGTIGVVITIAAGVILVLALLVRYARRVQRIRVKRRSHGATA